MNFRKLFSVVLAVLLTFQLFALASCKKPTGSDDSTTTPGTSITDTSTGDSAGGTEAKYKISFYTGEGAPTVRDMTGIKAGDKITAPEDPKWALHTFEGWYTDYGTYEHKFVFDTMPAENITLYAKWTSNYSADTLAQFEAELAANSEEGHLYIHYLRFDNVEEEYTPMTVWCWPYQQAGKTFYWEKDETGHVKLDEIIGATCDIDLTKIHNDAGKAGEDPQTIQFLKTTAIEDYSHGIKGGISDPENYMTKDGKIGFLIVYEETKNIPGQHWKSDGNADQFIYLNWENITGKAKEKGNPIWDNGSIHVFCVQDNVADYVYHLADQGDIVNPYENDDGTHVSSYNVQSSETLKVNNATSLLDTVSGVGYQIMVSSFADSDGDGVGDIRGIIENFDYLKKLNVDVLWLTPIQLSDSYHGYDIIDYKEVDPKFGTLDDYKELVQLCHDNDMKIIMDLVLNHTSTNNVWFQKSIKMTVEDGIDYRNFYQWRNNKLEPNLTEAWYPYSEYNYSYYAKFSPSMPELNYDNQATRDAIVDVAKYWLGILGNGEGIDGFRIDAVKHIYMADEVTPDDEDIIIASQDVSINGQGQEVVIDYSSNLTKNINFFTYFSNEIKSEYPNAYLVGENFDGHAYNVAPYYAAYDGMLNFYMYYQFGQIVKGEKEQPALIAGRNTTSSGSTPSGTNTHLLRSGEWDYEAVLGTEQAYRMYGLVGNKGSGSNTVMDSLFTSNHDIPRLMNNMVGYYSEGTKWNGGEVTSANAAYAQTYAKAVIATMMTMPGISWIYYGDEIGMSSNFYTGENEKSPHADRTYRQPFKWEAQADAKYTTNFSISGVSTLYVNWDEYNKTLPSASAQDKDSSSFLNVARYWTNAKSNDPVLRYGDYKYYNGFDSWGTSLFTFTRTYNGTTYVVVTNFSQYEYSNLTSIIRNGTVVFKTPGDSAGYDKLCAGGTVVVKI